MLLEMLSFKFIQRALIAGGIVALCAALLGVTLVLRRFSMIGDGLSHVGFGAMAVATALGAAPLYVAIPVVMAAAFLLLRIGKRGKTRSDAAIAQFSSFSLAVGLIVVSLSGGMNSDVNGYLYGSILAMSGSDVWLCAGLGAVVLTAYILLYNRLFIITFDEDFARATGVAANAYNVVVALLTAVTIVIGMRMVGTLLISSLIIFPALSAMRLFSSYKQVVIASGILAVLCLAVGIVVSYAFSLPVGASIVCSNAAAFALCAVVGKLLRG